MWRDTIRALRERLGLSQAELATRTGYTIKTVQRWEGGVSLPKRAVTTVNNRDFDRLSIELIHSRAPEIAASR